jgi:hypothetical protein
MLPMNKKSEANSPRAKKEQPRETNRHRLERMLKELLASSKDMRGHPRDCRQIVE